MYVIFDGPVDISEEEESRWRMKPPKTDIMREGWDALGGYCDPERVFLIPARETSGTRDVLALCFGEVSTSEAEVLPLALTTLSTLVRYEYGQGTRVEFWFSEGTLKAGSAVLSRINEYEMWEARTEGRAPNVYRVRGQKPQAWLMSNARKGNVHEDTSLS